MKLSLLLFAVIAVTGLSVQSAQAFYCRTNPDESNGVQFSPAYDNGNWIDSSPSTSLKDCTLQLRGMKNNVYCRANPDESYGVQFSPAYVGGNWLDNSPSTDLRTCLIQISEM